MDKFTKAEAEDVNRAFEDITEICNWGTSDTNVLTEAVALGARHGRLESGWMNETNRQKFTRALHSAYLASNAMHDHTQRIVDSIDTMNRTQLALEQNG